MYMYVNMYINTHTHHTQISKTLSNAPITPSVSTFACALSSLDILVLKDRYFRILVPRDILAPCLPATTSTSSCKYNIYSYIHQYISLCVYISLYYKSIVLI